MLLTLLYLAITVPPLDFAIRHILNTWLSRLKRHVPLLLWVPPRDLGWGGWARNAAISALNLGACTGVAVALGGNSALIVTISGATGVLCVSFVIPVANHLVVVAGRCVCLEAIDVLVD